MKRFMPLLLFLVCSVNAYELDLNLGSITHHFIVKDGVESEFEGGIAFNNRMITNAVISIGIIDEYMPSRYHAARVFTGQNSIHEFMLGGMIETGLRTDFVDYGLVVGLYGQNNQLFKDRGIDNIAFEIDDLGLMPVVGLGLHFKYAINQRLSIGVSNVISPVISNHTLLFRYRLS